MKMWIQSIYYTVKTAINSIIASVLIWNLFVQNARHFRFFLIVIVY